MWQKSCKSVSYNLCANVVISHNVFRSFEQYERKRFCLVNYSAQNTFCLADEKRIGCGECVFKPQGREFSFGTNYSVWMSGWRFLQREVDVLFPKSMSRRSFSKEWSWEGEMTRLSSLCLFPIGTSKNYYIWGTWMVLNHTKVITTM